MNDPRNHLLLSTSGVARLLDVHPSTIKRWTEEGSLEATRTEGGHRRFHLTDLLRGAQEKGASTFLDPFHPWEANVWTAIQKGLREGDYQRLASLGMAWLRQGETELLGRLFFEMGRRDEIPFTDFIDKAVSTFMTRVGEEWMAGRLQVGEEHMATETILEALMRIRFSREVEDRPVMEARRPKPVAVVGAAAGDLHDLGVQSIRSILEMNGWRVYYLGSNVPIEDFSIIQRAQVAQLVCISFSPASTRHEILQAVETLEQGQSPRMPHALALGGGFEEVSQADFPTHRFTAMTLARSAGEFQEWLDTFQDRGEEGDRWVA
jgi:excisionase family DNA binding protein